MAITIKGFRRKQIASGHGHYWEPTRAEKKAGWSALTLDRDMVKAIVQAERRNDEIADWRAGGARPRTVKKFTARATVSAGIKKYEEAGFPSVKVRGTFVRASTQKVYKSALKKLDAWAGSERADQITPQNVGKWIQKTLLILYKPEVAHATVRVSRTLFKWLEIEGVIAKGTNPFEDPGMATPDPRDQMWEYADEVAFDAGAAAIEYPGLAFARELAENIGQREADLLALDSTKWRAMRELELIRSYAELAAIDDRGDVWGIYIRQGKGNRWIGIPIVGPLRRRIEAEIAANAKREVPTTAILVDDATGRPWQVRQFIRMFTKARDKAVESGHAALADLQFRDLRRTCVVRLGELGLDDQAIAAITGHKLGTIKKILETYMPRTTAMAARAVVVRMGDRARTAEKKEQSA